MFYLIKVIDINIEQKRAIHAQTETQYTKENERMPWQRNLYKFECMARSRTLSLTFATTFTTAVLFILRNKCHFLQNIRLDNAIAKFSNDNKSHSASRKPTMKL